MATAVIFGSGFVGSAVRTWVERAFDVVVLDLPTHPELADRGPAAADLVDRILDETAATVVINTSGRLTGSDEQLRDANVSWPAWLVERLTARPDQPSIRFVHLGSAAEYGDPGSAAPIPEDAPTNPNGSYGVTKLAGTEAVLAARASGLDAVVVRAFNLVGPGTTTASPLHQFVSDVTALPAEGGEVVVWWPGTRRDFVLLDDLGESVAALAVAPTVPDIVNVASAVGISFGEIVEAVAAHQGKPVTVRSLDRRGIEAVIGANDRLRAILGRAPTMTARLIAERCELAH